MENREKFFARVQPFFPPSTIRDIELAYYLAKYGHRSQVRKEKDEDGNPLRYFEHLRRVALILMDEVKCMRPEMIISAILHDSIEDTRDLTPELLEHTFGPDVCSMIKTLSKSPAEGYIERLQMCQDWRPLVIKACDRLDNLRSLLVEGISPEFVKKQTKETINKYYPIFDNLLEIIPKSYVKGVSVLRDEIRKTTERCVAVIYESAKDPNSGVKLVPTSIRMKILNSLNPPGLEMHVSDLVAKHANSTIYGVSSSQVRAAILELNEDGAVVMDTAGNIRRLP